MVIMFQSGVMKRLVTRNGGMWILSLLIQTIMCTVVDNQNRQIQKFDNDSQFLNQMGLQRYGKRSIQ